MAIIKTFNTPYGVEANYHRLLRVSVDSQYRQVELEVAVYHTEEARTTNKEPLLIKRVAIPFWKFKSDPRQAFYKILELAPDSYLDGGITAAQEVLDIENSLIPKSMDQIIAETPPLPPHPPTPGV